MKMNKAFIYQIEFFSFWHAGSGLSGSTYADSLVLKNGDNLPVIPGKTLKGLLREAAEAIHGLNDKLVSTEFITDVFGETEKVNGTEKRKEGEAFFGNATLSENLSKSLVEKKLTNSLYQVISSTQIDENGQARDHSLRQLEVTVPLTLYGSIEHLQEEAYKEQMQQCFNWIKQMGVNRNRGLGKCKFSIFN